MNLATYLAYLNSKPVEYILGILNPTASLTVADVLKLPYKECWNTLTNRDLGSSNEMICRQDWDSFETSWDFQRHPLLQYAVFTPQMVAKEEANGYLPMNGIADAYHHWEQVCNDRFNQLKANEEELNRIFINIYGLQDELTPEVEAETFALSFPMQLAVCLVVIRFMRMDLYMQVEIGMRNLAPIMEPLVILNNIPLVNLEILPMASLRKSFAI